MGFQYVLVPASASDDMQELTFTGKSELGDDHFLKHLKAYFGSMGKGVDRNVLLKNMAEHAKKDVKELTEGINATVLDGICQSEALSIFPVMTPTKATGFYTVSLYCDDKGIAKDLPLNERAIGIVKSCGYDNQLYRGDVFFSRVHDNEPANEPWRRVDFTMKDCSSEAKWLLQTREQRKNASSPEAAHSLQGLQQTVQNSDEAKPAPQSYKVAKGETEAYSWEDKGEEVEIIVKGKDFKKSDVKITFKTKHLTVKIGSEVVFDEELYGNVSCEDCTWTLVDGGIDVTLLKRSALVWNSLMAE